MAVLAKRLVPPVIASPTGLFGWAAARQSAPAVVVDDPPPMRPFTPNLPTGVSTPVKWSSADVPRRLIAWPLVVVTAWLAGAAAVGSAVVIASCRLDRRLRRTAVPVPADVLRLADDVGQSLGLRRPPRLIATTADVGPALVGVIRPAVVLPARLLSAAGADVRAVLAHELAHLRRGDAVVAAVQRVAVAVWWFYPLVWLMSARLTAAREGCCDEAAVAGLSLDPLAYAQTLLDIARRRRAQYPSPSLGVHAMRLTTQRLTHLTSDAARLDGRPPRAAWVAALGMAALILPGAGPDTRPDPAAQGPDVVATDPTTDPWIVTLPNGITAELLGLSENPSAGKTWWRPDGSPLVGQAILQRTGRVHSKTGVPREVAVRLTHMPAGPVECTWAFVPDGSNAGGGLTPTGPGHAIANTAVDAPGGPDATLAVRFGLADGPWQAVAALTPNSCYTAVGPPSGSFLTGPATEVDGGTQVTLTHTLSGAYYRLVAIDKRGAEHAGDHHISQGSGGMTQMTAHFPRLSPDDVRTFDL